MDLLEYEQKGFLFSGNITLKRVNYINRILSIGKEEVLRVLTVDAKKGFIDLCKKDVKADEIDMCKIRYGKSKQVENIVKILAGHMNSTMEFIYKKMIWPLYKTHEHALDALKEILDGNYAIYCTSWDANDIKNKDELGGLNCIIDKVGSCSYWDSLFDTLASVIDTNDTYTLAALDYAMQQTQQRVVSLGIGTTLDTSNAAHRKKSDESHEWDVRDQVRDMNDKYVGYVFLQNYKGLNSRGYNHGYAINLTNITKAFYTYFAQYMQGFASTDLKVSNLRSASTFVTDPGEMRDFSFNILSEVDTTGNNMLIAGFYDALFNQIATKGWVENENVTNKEYMQTMLKNGCMFLSALADDDYYYMSNYATNSYIKEVTDEEGIALAEAKYQREKAKINSKENIVDMKMKNLDTEITALTTEYETVKSVITNGIKTGFNRYEA